MQKYLLTSSEFMTLARTVSKHIDDEKINIYIEETENIDIRSALGDALYLDIRDNEGKYQLLLDGGEYLLADGSKRSMVGLKKTISYYTYARLMKNGDYNVDRYGTNTGVSEYSTSAVYKEKVTVYNDAFSVADRYLKECINYLQAKADEYPLYKGRGRMKANRTTYRILGE